LQTDGPNRDRRTDPLRSIYTPFWIVFGLGALGLFLFSIAFTVVLDRQAIRSSERIFASALEDRSLNLNRLVLEYGYWDEAVDNLVTTLDLTWIEQNLTGYVYDELGIYGFHVLDENGKNKFTMIDGQVRGVDPYRLYGPALADFANMARQSAKDREPVPHTSILGDETRLFLASAVRLTTYTDTEYRGTDHILVMSVRLSGTALADVAERFDFSNLRISSQEPGRLNASQPITAPDGSLIGYFIWSPALHGSQHLPFIITAVMLIYGTMLIAARRFINRTGELLHDLHASKQQADLANTRLAQQARTDALTGLGNRWLLDQDLTELRAREDAGNESALLYIDLDHFKSVNDSYGHEAGDGVLHYTAKVLQTFAPEADAYRLGGDEFAVIFKDKRREEVLATAESIVAEFRHPYYLKGTRIKLGVSIGVAFSSDTTQLLRSADNALYTAKRLGKGQVVVYQPAKPQLISNSPARSSSPGP